MSSLSVRLYGVGSCCRSVGGLFGYFGSVVMYFHDASWMCVSYATVDVSRLCSGAM